MSHIVKQFGYDMLPVFAGVLIALFINNFQQSRQERKFVNRILITVFEENDKNIEMINALVNKQEKTIDTLSYYADDTNTTVFQLIRKVNGLSTPDLVNNGANFLFNSNPTLLDIELLMELSGIQAEIENFNLNTEKLMSTFYEDIYSTSPEAKRRLMMIMNDVMYTQRNILKLSKAFNSTYRI